MKTAALIATTLWFFAGTIVSAAEPDKAEVVPMASSYRFMGGERIRLAVPATVGATLEQLVSDDGYVSLPTGSSLNIKGKSILDAQAAITAVLEKESGARRVFAAIGLLEVPPRRVFVGGEVRTPQAIVLPAGGPLTLAAALMAAGGSLPEADLTRVKLVRGGEAKNPGVVYDASKLSLTAGGDLGPALEAGDVVTVPRGEVFVLAGEVIRPGALTRRDMALNAGEPVRLSRLLFSSGGLRPTANRKDIRLIRMGSDGVKSVMPINLDDTVGSKTAKAATTEINEKADPLLKDGDIILAGSTGGVSILGRVTRPGVYPLSGDKIKLTKLIALAGGFTQFAKTSSVVVVRASSPNTPIRVDVDSVTKDGSVDKDVDLDDGDLVFVGERLL